MGNWRNFPVECSKEITATKMVGEDQRGIVPHLFANITATWSIKKETSQSRNAINIPFSPLPPGFFPRAHVGKRVYGGAYVGTDSVGHTRTRTGRRMRRVEKSPNNQTKC